MRFDLAEAARAVGHYLAENPRAAVQMALGVIGQRLVLPLAALRWLAARGNRDAGDAWDVELEARPPLLRVAASAHWGHADVRVTTSVRVLALSPAPGKLEARLELSDFAMLALGESPGPMRQLLASGALDMARPGSVLAMMSPRPAALVAAGGREITVDLLRVEALIGEPRVRQVLELVTPALQIREIWCEPEQLVARIEPLPESLVKLFDRVMGTRPVPGP